MSYPICEACGRVGQSRAEIKHKLDCPAAPVSLEDRLELIERRLAELKESDHVDADRLMGVERWMHRRTHDHSRLATIETRLDKIETVLKSQPLLYNKPASHTPRDTCVPRYVYVTCDNREGNDGSWFADKGDAKDAVRCFSHGQEYEIELYVKETSVLDLLGLSREMGLPVEPPSYAPDGYALELARIAEVLLRYGYGPDEVEGECGASAVVEALCERLQKAES
jgi:hypothetical protein